MPFQIAVAADVYGTKYNKVFSFALCPAMKELLNAVESVYDTCARSHRPAGYADVPFKAQALQLHQAVERRWVDVASTAQILDGAQLFCFQPNSIWHTDAEGPIPAPDSGITWVSAPERTEGRAGKDTGPPPSLSEKLRTVFHHIDKENRGFCRYSDVRGVLASCEIEFTMLSSADVFRQADADGDGCVSYDEWVKFALDNASIVDAVYFRIRDSKNEAGGWLASIPKTTTLSPKETTRATQLQSLHSEAAWARERVKSMREYEAARREGSIARLNAEAAETKKAVHYSNFVHSQITEREHSP